MILTVPTVPNALRGIEQPDEVEFCGGFDKVKRRMPGLFEPIADIMKKGFLILKFE